MFLQISFLIVKYSSLLLVQDLLPDETTKIQAPFFFQVKTFRLTTKFFVGGVLADPFVLPINCTFLTMKLLIIWLQDDCSLTLLVFSFRPFLAYQCLQLHYFLARKIVKVRHFLSHKFGVRVGWRIYRKKSSVNRQAGKFCRKLSLGEWNFVSLVGHLEGRWFPNCPIRWIVPESSLW